jgi:hypothetical protein
LFFNLTRDHGACEFASHGRASGRFHSGAACFHFSFTPAGVFSRSRAADADKAPARELSHLTPASAGVFIQARSLFSFFIHAGRRVFMQTRSGC